MSRYRFVRDHRGEYGVVRLCRVLGVSRSGFYGWLARPEGARRRRDADLARQIGVIHHRSHGTYGAPRIHAELRRRGERCARKRVARLMGELGLVGAHGRRRPRRPRPGGPPAPDLVRRRFSPAGADLLWAADVTQLRTQEGWLHLAVVLDLYSRRALGWASAPAADTGLVLDALAMALARRRPAAGCIHHSDRGSAYTSLAVCRRLRELGLAQSVGAVGDCYDNAAVEAFFSTLKRELRWIHHPAAPWPSRARLRAALFDYIEGFYNPHRIQERLGYRSPIDYERLATS